MAFLEKLHIVNVRNVANATLEDLQQFNVITGLNGAGKTSVLEAISLLGLGRSFRSRKISSVIAEGQSSLTVFGLLSTEQGVSRLGVRRSVDHTDIKIDGRLLQSASSLAATLPLLSFDSTVFELIEGGPQRRREYVDWVLFHVEQERFYRSWLSFHRALKQRNGLLKRGNICAEDLLPWDEQLCLHGESIAAMRVDCLKQLNDIFQASGIRFSLGPVALELDSGWKDGAELSQALLANVDRDRRYKTTTVGPHRMAIDVTVGGAVAKDVLSRGQIKMLASQLKLAAAKLVQERRDSRVLILLDDLAAETDTQHRHRLLADIAESGYQCFVSGVFEEDILSSIPEGIKKAVFHVEHGRITKSSNYE